MQTLQSEGSSDRAQVAGAVPSTTTGPGCSPAEAAGAASASRERASTASPTPPCNGIVLPLQHTAPLTRFYLRTALLFQAAIPNIPFLSLYDLALLTRTQLFFFFLILFPLDAVVWLQQNPRFNVQGTEATTVENPFLFHPFRPRPRLELFFFFYKLLLPFSPASACASCICT